MEKISNRLMIAAFIAMLVLPFLLAHREPGRVSDSENRTLADYPELLTQDHTLNLDYMKEFENWISDNARGRTSFLKINAMLQYHLFGKIAKNLVWAGTDGELFGAGEGMLETYQHLDLLTEEELQNYTLKMQELSDYLEARGIAFYYMQCYDKETVYSEHFMRGVNQIGDLSEAQQVVNALKADTNVAVVPVYDAIMAEKVQKKLYYQVIDTLHWNDSGAYLGYLAFMKQAQTRFPEITYLTKEDYRMEAIRDKTEILGFTYPIQEDSIRYVIDQPKAELMAKERFSYLDYQDYIHYYKNSKSTCKKRLLIIGDSFIRQSMKDDLAEGFAETLFVDWGNLPKLKELVDDYQPDLLLFESAEMCLANTVPLIQETEFE